MSFFEPFSFIDFDVNKNYIGVPEHFDHSLYKLKTSVLKVDEQIMKRMVCELIVHVFFTCISI